MIAVPPKLLELLELCVGTRQHTGLESGRLVMARKPQHSLEELLAQCDTTRPDSSQDRAWLDSKPVGNELL